MPRSWKSWAREVMRMCPCSASGRNGLSRAGSSALSRIRSQPGSVLSQCLRARTAWSRSSSGWGSCISRASSPQPAFRASVRLGIEPEDGLVLVAIAIGVLDGGLGLADAAQAADGLGQGGPAPLGELLPQVGEDVLASREEGVPRMGDVPESAHRRSSRERRDGPLRAFGVPPRPCGCGWRHRRTPRPDSANRSPAARRSGPAWSFPNGAACQLSTCRRMTGMTRASPFSCRSRARFSSTSQQ